MGENTKTKSKEFYLWPLWMFHRLKQNELSFNILDNDLQYLTFVSIYRAFIAKNQKGKGSLSFENFFQCNAIVLIRFNINEYETLLALRFRQTYISFVDEKYSSSTMLFTFQSWYMQMLLLHCSWRIEPLVINFISSFGINALIERSDRKWNLRNSRRQIIEIVTAIEKLHLVHSYCMFSKWS